MKRNSQVEKMLVDVGGGCWWSLVRHPWHQWNLVRYLVRHPWNGLSSVSYELVWYVFLTRNVSQYLDSLTLARAWGDVNPRQFFLSTRYSFLRQNYDYLHSLLFYPSAQGLQVPGFYDTQLLSYALVSNVMSRHAFSAMFNVPWCEAFHLFSYIPD